MHNWIHNITTAKWYNILCPVDYIGLGTSAKHDTELKFMFQFNDYYIPGPSCSKRR